MKVLKLFVAMLFFFASAVAHAQQAVVPEAPGPDVPAACAKFFGSWVGNWQYIGRQWLRVVRVEKTCAVQYAYLGTDAEPKSNQYYLSTVDENGVLAIRCGRGGTCTFKMHGDDLWARYSDSNNNSNNTVFGRK